MISKLNQDLAGMLQFQLLRIAEKSRCADTTALDSFGPAAQGRGLERNHGQKTVYPCGYLG